MKRFVNGDEIELDPTAAETVSLGDRIGVRTDRGLETAVAVRKGGATVVSFRGRQYTVERKGSRTRSGGTSSGELRAPMPGQIVDVRASIGEAVTKGTVLVVLEAMKTQQPFAAPFDGTVKELPVDKGQQVGDGQLLAKVEPNA